MPKAHRLSNQEKNLKFTNTKAHGELKGSEDGWLQTERFTFIRVPKRAYECLWCLLDNTHLKKAISCYAASKRGIQNHAGTLPARNDELEHFQP